MDLFTSASTVIIYVAMLSRGFEYSGNHVADNVFCVVVEGAVFTAAGVVANKAGLVVITLERYFKIVHALAHRKYYRNWMTKVGVALPWIYGACVYVFPAMGTSRVVNGKCLRFAVWPNKAMAKVRY